MANKESDILLIRKYLNGELDARAMHQLEARAQDDPFLADALEGYEKTGGHQQPALAGLSLRLRQRVEQKQVRRMIPLRVLAIAASVLVVFTIGWLLLVNNKKEKAPQIAQVITAPPVKTQPAAALAKDTAASPQLARQAAPPLEKETILKPADRAAAPKTQYEPPAAAPVTPTDKSTLANADIIKTDSIADATPLNELVVMNYTPEKAKKVTDTQQGLSFGHIDNDKAKPAAIMEQQLVSKVPGVIKTPTLGSPGSQRPFVEGRIIDEIDGRPLPGVSVRASGTSYGAVTDRDGKFYAPSDSIKRGLVVSRLGYNSAKISAPKGDSLKTISLAPSDFPLKQVAIANNIKNPAAAHPQIGWNKYNKYLGTTAISPDGKAGTVSLSFSVDKTGAITGTAVVTSLSDAANKKAIELVKKGPKWVGNANSKPERVELTINF